MKNEVLEFQHLDNKKSAETAPLAKRDDKGQSLILTCMCCFE